MSGRVMIHGAIYGIKQNRYKYILFLIYMIIFSVAQCFYYNSLQMGRYYGIYGMLCTTTLSGLAEYIPDMFEQIKFPAGWVILTSFIPYILGDYVESDLHGMGIQKLILLGRKKWWLEKCVWLFMSAIIYCLIFYSYT